MFAQGAVSAKIEGQRLAGLSQAILQLVYENTMEKLYKGVLDVGPKELQLFMEGPVKSVMRQKTLTFADSKIQHALFFLAVAEQNKDSKPVRELFEQHSRLDVYEQWYAHYVQFLASGPIAVEGLGAEWQSAQTKSLQLTNAWKAIHSPLKN